MTDPSFVPERRRVIAACQPCGTTHTTPVPAGYTAYCGVCGREMRQDGSHPAHPEASVSLPTAPAQDTLPLEETRRGVLTRYGVDYCEECTFPITFCKGHDDA